MLLGVWSSVAAMFTAATARKPTPFKGGRKTVFSYARAGRSASVGRDLERGRPLAERADASTAIGRAQRGAAREREGAFGNAAITAEVRYSFVTKHYREEARKP